MMKKHWLNNRKRNGPAINNLQKCIAFKLTNLGLLHHYTENNISTQKLDPARISEFITETDFFGIKTDLPKKISRRILLA